MESMPSLFQLVPSVQGGMLRHQNLPNCSCDMEPNITVIFNTIPICNISLLPTWILALLIGLMGGARIHQLGPAVLGSLSYSTTFFMYAAMITSGFMIHSVFLLECGAGSVTPMFVHLALTDSSLTSCVAISFFFNGLVDLRLISERNLWSRLFMGLTYIVIFILEFGGFVNTSPTHPIIYLPGVVGGVSFLLFTEYFCLLCKSLGAWSIEGLWYYSSDLAMFFILLYTLTTRESLPANTNTDKSIEPLISKLASGRSEGGGNWSSEVSGKNEFQVE